MEATGTMVNTSALGQWGRTLATVMMLAAGLAVFSACSGGGDGGGGGGGTPSGATQTLTVDKNGNGTVTSPQGTINCGTTCSGSFAQGSAVTLNAAADPGSVFSGWGKVCAGTGPCTVTLSNDMTVPANFSAAQAFTLTVNKSGNGTVTSTVPAGAIQCGVTCTASLAQNTAVTLTAAPDPGNTFVGWGGACSGTGACNVTITGNVIVQANFSSSTGFDFALAATPSSQLVFGGTNVSYTITGTLTHGSANPVTLSVVSGCPANATCTFTPNPITPTNTGTLSNLVVTTASNTALGAVDLLVQGTDGTVTHQIHVALRVVKTGASASPPRFGYVANSFDDTLSIYTIDANNGQLRQHGYVGTGSSPVSVAIDNSGKFVYVANSDVGTISSYAMTQPPSPSAGGLTSIGSAVASGKLTDAVVANPTKNVLYAVNFATSTTISAGSVSAYTINTGTGVLTPLAGSPYQAGQSSTGMAIEATGTFAYVANYPSNPLTQPPISAFKIQADGSLQPVALGSLFPNPSAAITIDPTGKFLYTADDIFDKIAVYLINSTTGALTKVQTVSTPEGPSGLSIDPSGKFLYVSNSSANTVAGYAINSVSGALTTVTGSPFAAGTGPSSVTVDPSGNFVYVTNLNDNTVSEYFLDQGTGSLTYLGLSRSRQQPAAMAIVKGATPVAYSPTFAYTTNQASNNVSEFSINPATGQLTALAQSPFAVAGAPVALSITPSALFTYVVKSSTNQVSGFSIAPGTGFLTEVPNSPFTVGQSPQDIVVESSSRFVYVVNQSFDNVSGYQINSNGSLTAQLVAPATGHLPVAIAADPTGEYVYTANQGANTVSGFKIDSSDGTLSSVIGLPPATGTLPQSVAADPSGQFVYVANGTSSTISGYTIRATTGELIPISGSPFASGTTPSTVTVHPSGKWVFVVNSADGTLSVYRVDPLTGVLTLASAPVSIGVILPDGVTVDPSGRFVYVTAWGTQSPPGPGSIVSFSFDPGTGLLTPIGLPITLGIQPTAVQTTGTIQ
jgi:6-phosphogluconolactonase (cycloisomerase 2 family)